MPAARIQPRRGSRLSSRNPLARGISAHFLFNGDFGSIVNGKRGNPIVSAGGPTFAADPFGQYAKPNGSGNVTTNLLPSDIGFAGSSARTVIIDFYKPDANATKAIFSFGDTSSGARTQFTLLQSFYREITLAMYGTDVGYLLHSTSGSGARVFLAITYDGGTTLKFRSYAKVDTTGQIAFNSQTTTLGGPLATGNTVPLNLFGGGTYPAAWGSCDFPVYHLSMYGGRCLSDAEIDSLYNDRHQVIAGQPAMLSAASEPTASGATASPPGVSASSAVGSAAASGQAKATPAGVASTASVGAATAIGTTVVNGTASPAGVSAAAAVSAPAASGAASKAVAGVSASASVGTATAAGVTVINGTAAPAGVSASAAVGSASASGATVIHGNASVAGVATSSTLGAAAARGLASVAAIGVQAAAAVGSASANGGVSVAGNAQPAGVSAAASVGTPSTSGATVTHGNGSAAGVAASASVGAVAISASASTQPAGVSVLATIGQQIASGQIQVDGVAYPGGVLAYARVGSVTAGSRTYASAPAGPGYSRPFLNTTRPRQVNTRRR